VKLLVLTLEPIDAALLRATLGAETRFGVPVTYALISR
jgi:hypothetical protein